MLLYPNDHGKGEGRGRDLLALVWNSGRKIGEILEAVETRQLEGGFASGDEALDWVNEEIVGAKHRTWKTEHRRQGRK